MGFKSLRVSDISGVELQDNEVVEVNVIDAGKKFDAHADELKTLKPVTNVVKLQFRYASGQVADVLVSKTEFDKLIPADKLAGFDSNRGRRSGYSPTAAKNGAASGE
ncbi:hypothetical protein DVS77_21685 [Mycolicibacterium moriokaense]|nr:hypothetical protein DVS77_21685 [Mycolicibacterium moriokaense]